MVPLAPKYTQIIWCRAVNKMTLWKRKRVSGKRVSNSTDYGNGNVFLGNAFLGNAFLGNAFLGNAFLGNAFPFPRSVSFTRESVCGQ